MAKMRQPFISSRWEGYDATCERLWGDVYLPGLAQLEKALMAKRFRSRTSVSPLSPCDNPPATTGDYRRGLPRGERDTGVWVLLALSLLVVIGSLAWHASNLDAFSLSNDEGTHLMWAWLVHSGHPLYSETASVQPPLLIVWLDWAFDVGGVSLVTGRLLVLGFLALTIATLIWLARLVLLS